MSYSKRTWVNGEILDADKMNHLEQGVYDNSQDIATINTELDNKANIDGSYEGMTVGNAEQLVSTVGVENNAPYTFRTTGGAADVGDRMNLKTIVGGTVAWNQIVQTSDTSVTVTSGHKYLSRINGTYTVSVSNGSAISINDGTKDNVFDLTAMFGSAIANYAYTLESGTAGAGVAWLKSYGFFTKPYYPYAASLQSVKTTAHITYGFNQWDEQWEVGGINFDTGNNTNDNTRIRSKNYIPVIGGATYYVKSARIAWFEYDANKTYLRVGNSGSYVGANATFTPSNDSYYIRFQVSTTYGTTYKNDICINLHWDGERDGEYEPFEQHTYALDDVELRGIPKLDASNNLYYDGDQYTPDGTVTRRYGIVNLGTLTWSNATVSGTSSCTNPPSDMKLRTAYFNAVCNGLTPTSYNDRSGVGTIFYSGVSLTVLKSSFGGQSGASVKSALSGVYLVYELVTPTTESADAYTELQICDDFGTEEFVDAATRDFEMPVGSVAVYAPNLRAKLEMAPNSPDTDGDYLMRHSNGTNEYVLFSEVKELPDFPTTDGTYVLKCTVADGTATLSWVSE